MRMLLTPGQYMVASLLLLLWRLARSLVILLGLLLYNGGVLLGRGIRWVWRRTAHSRAVPSGPDRTVVPFRRRR
jgi:hypothetical protein